MKQKDGERDSFGPVKSDTSDDSISRRRLLQTSGISIATIVGASVPSAAKKPAEWDSNENYSEDDINEFRKSVANLYGEKEAEAATEIVRDNLENSAGLSNDEIYNQIAQDILKNPATSRGADELQKTNSEIKNHQDTVVSSDNGADFDQTSAELSSVHANSVHNINITGGATRKHSNYLCDVGAWGNAPNQTIGAVTNASMFGNGYAAGRIFGHFRPSSKRTYYITSKYYRQGYVRNAAAKVYFYVRRKGEGIQRKVAEDLVSRKGTTTRTVSFSLRAGKPYTIGVELYTQADAGGDPGAVADYYFDTLNAGKRHLKVKKFTIS